MKRSTLETSVVLGLILAVVWFVPPLVGRLRHLCPVRPDGVRQAEAIPAFARKYNVSCQQCHVAFPVLNDYGRQFKMNGYVRERGSEDGVLKSQDGRLWTEKLFPLSAIIRSRPFDNGRGTNPNGNGPANSGNNMGSGQTANNNGFKMEPVDDVDMFIGGGDAARNISWFGELDANFTGFTPASGDLQFGYHPLTYLNFILARRGFYAMDPYQTIAGNESPTVANRALDGSFTDQSGLSGNAIGEQTQTFVVYGNAEQQNLGSLYYAAGASAGAISGPAAGDNAGQNAKSGHFRMAFDTTKGFVLGGFGSFGHESPAAVAGTANNPIAAPSPFFGNVDQVRFLKTGVDTLVELGDVVGRGAFLYSHDSDPFSLVGSRTWTDRAAYAEVMYVFKLGKSSLPFLVPLIRENWYSTYNGTRQFNYVTAQLAHFFAPNLKAFVETSFDTKTDIQGGPLVPVGGTERVPKGSRITGQIEVGF